MDGYFHRYHVERIPASCRHQCSALFCTSHLPYDGYGQSDGTDSDYGCHQYPLHFAGCLHGRKMGTKTVADIRFHRYGDRGVWCSSLQLCHRRSIHLSGCQHHGVQCFIHVQLGAYLLGIDCGNLSEYHSRCGCGPCRGIPVDFQLHRFIHIRADV